MRAAYIFDVDGTVADLSHRLHHIQNGNHDREAFEAGASDDLPIWPVIQIIRAINSAGFCTLATSGRAERLRQVTEDYFVQFSIPYDRLYMRANGDTRADHVVKRQILQGIREDGYTIEGVIDDRQSVVDMWREEGLTCLQCAPNFSAKFETPIGIYPVLTMMIGPSGSGKTTWLASEDAKLNYGVHPQHVISSDQVRMDLFGEMRVDRNDMVYETLHKIVKTRLAMGLPVTVDATNIRTKDRTTIAGLAGGVCPVRYIVIDRPMADKLARGGWRLNVHFKRDQNLIQRHDEVFRSNIKAIMAGDGLQNVTVFDIRVKDPGRQAAA